jgi:hypothetical protein
MSRADELRAELELAELEEKLSKAKATKSGPSRDLKDKVRAARQAYRATREGNGA